MQGENMEQQAERSSKPRNWEGRQNYMDTYTMVGFRADYESHCESSMAVLLFKNKHSIQIVPGPKEITEVGLHKALSQGTYSLEINMYEVGKLTQLTWFLQKTNSVL